MTRIFHGCCYPIAGTLLLMFLACGMDCFALDVPRTEESPLLPDGFFRVFVAKSPIHFILVEKDKQRLRLFKFEGGELKVVTEYPCATGERAGKKKSSGDSRTPEGIYFVTKAYKDKKVTIFGKRAFHLDFPNVFDKRAGIKGNGIYIHGTNKRLKQLSTNGCIVLRNKDLDKLAGFLVTEATPVLIVSRIDDVQWPETQKIDVNRFSLVKSLLLPEQIDKDRTEFNCFYLISDGIQTVAVGEFSLFENDYYRLRGYIVPDREEVWASKERILNGNPLTTEQFLPRYSKNRQKILEFIETWRKAWESKDLKTYIACYHESFKHGRMNLDAYRSYKARLNKKYKFIKVDISGASVHWTRNGAEVAFRQDYRSDRYHAKGRKTLTLTFKGQRWGIEREDWFPAKNTKRAKR